MPVQSKRLSILAPSEVKELYSIPTLSQSQKEFFFQLNALEQKSFKDLKSLHAKVFFVLLLGHFKNKPVTLDFNAGDVKDDIEHILKRYCAGKHLVDRRLDPSQKTRLYQRIYKLTQSQGFSAKQQKTLAKRACEMARICVNPRYLFDECVANLTGARIALPKYTTLQDIVSQALSTEKKRIQAVLSKTLNVDLEMQVQYIIETKEPFSLLTTLKRLPKDFTYKELGKEIKSFELLTELYPKVVTLLDELNLSNENIEHYASLVDFYTITKLRRFEKSTTVLYILCFIHRRFRQINDNLVNAFIYNVRKLKEEATTHAKIQAYESVKSVGSKVKKASALLSMFIDDAIDDSTPFKDVRSRAFKVIPKNDIALISNYLADIKIDIQSLEWQFYEDNSTRIQRNLRRLFCCLSFEGRLNEERISSQISHTQEDLRTNKKLLKIDRRLISKGLKPYLYDDIDSDKPSKVNDDRYEVMLYQIIRDSIDAGHIFVPNSQEYRSLDDDLVNEREWKQKDELIAESELEIFKDRAEIHIDRLIERLETKLGEVCDRVNNGDNQVVILTDRSGQTKWKLPSNSVGPSVNNPFFEKLRQVHIGELLTHVNDEVGFLDAFTHVQPRYQKSEIDLHNIIACLVANGTNFGLTKMAHISDRSIDHLRTTQANFLRPETLHQANDLISNKISSLPIFKHYNIQEGNVHASIDGQKFECRLNSFKTRYSSKYFGLNKGVSSLTLVANHVPINAKIIGSNEYEGHHAFDLLYNNTSDIQPNVLSSDNHGTNRVNFALLDMFGYSFAPRYAQFGSVISKLFSVKTENDNQVIRLTKPIQPRIIVDEWESIQKIIISLQQKKATQATIIRKLSSYKRNNRVTAALVEYDRIIKCLYMLDYLDDSSLRQFVQRALNRGEAYHQLRRSVASINGNKFRGGSDQEITLWNECARLITNAIIYFNSLILSKLLRHFEKSDDTEKVELIKRLSPVAWANINLNGTYTFAIDSKPLDLDGLVKDILV